MAGTDFLSILLGTSNDIALTDVRGNVDAFAKYEGAYIHLRGSEISGMMDISNLVNNDDNTFLDHILALVQSRHYEIVYFSWCSHQQLSPLQERFKCKISKETTIHTVFTVFDSTELDFCKECCLRQIYRSTAPGTTKHEQAVRMSVAWKLDLSANVCGQCGSVSPAEREATGNQQQ